MNIPQQRWLLVREHKLIPVVIYSQIVRVDIRVASFTTI
eukprot:SAG31_NODE_86_length_26973_cov_16.850897_25_plen_39_part_00